MENQSKRKMAPQSSAIYGMAFIGALVYFIQHATTFWAGVLGFLKAIVWPAILVYKWLEFLSTHAP
jgi:hypothetical protein